MSETCRQFDALIARRAQLTQTEAAQLEAHLVGCGACRELAGALKPIDDAALVATGVAATLDTISAAPAGPERDPSELRTDRYRITGEVGRGGLGRVLRALDQVLDRPVALKELFSASEAMRSRFVREALITARLQHPSIVPVYDAGHLGDRSPFYAMKLVAGRPLDKAIAEASTLAQRLALLPTVLAVADAIAYAHNERIIHRDLKPPNILVGKYGETIVIDWGLAKDLAADDRDAVDAGPYRGTDVDKTVAGAMMGTPAYMAPEQAAGEAVDERTDVYALGAILYQLVSGAIPHEGDTLEEMVSHVITGQVRPLAERVPEVPRDLAAIVGKAMALEPAKRYANAQGFADDLRRFSTGQLVASHTYRTRDLVRRWLARHRGIVLVATAALALVSIISITSVVRIVRAQHAAEDAAVVATRENNAATEMLANTLEEQGRQELLAGRPARAAVYLTEAQTKRREQSVAIRALLADAMPSIEPIRSFAIPGEEITGAALSPDGKVATTSMGGSVAIWDVSTGTIVATLKGHRETVRAVAFGADSTRIVTASLDHTAKLWDGDGKVLATFEHPDEVRSVALARDGSRVVTIANDGIARLWIASTGTLVGTLEGAVGEVSTAAFSADGTRVVTASEDRAARVWDATTGKLVVTLDGHTTPVECAAFSPEGSLIVTATIDGTAKLWDARTGKLRASLEGHASGIDSAVFSPDGTRVVTASVDHTAKLWDVQTGKLLLTFEGHDGEVHSAAFSPDGKRVVTASLDRTAKLWDVETGRAIASFEGHRDEVISAAFRAGGTQVLTTSEDGTTKLWDATPKRARVSLASGTLVSGQLDLDGERIVTAGEDHGARIWNTRTGKQLASLEGAASVFAMFDASGTRVVTAGTDHTAKVWDAKTGAQVCSLDHGDELRFALFSPDGRKVATIGGRQGARIWDAKTGTLIASVAAAPERLDQLHAAMFSADGSRFVTVGGANTTRIWNAGTGAQIAELPTQVGVAYAAFSPDGARVVTADFDEAARVWDVTTGKLLVSLEGHTGMLYRARFSPDGERIVTASADHSAKLWDSRSGKLLASLDGHADQLFDASFSADGARVLTASADHSAKIWDARTGKLLASLDGQAGEVVDAKLSRDGTRVVTATRDGTISTLDVHLEARDAEAVRRVVSTEDPWMLDNGVLVPRRR